MDKICSFCFNAYVAATLPTTEDDYFEPELTDDNDFSSATIGFSGEGHQMYFNAGGGKACNIEVCEWGEDNRWHTVAEYFPKYCPECGRELKEYKIDERGTSFEKIKTTF